MHMKRRERGGEGEAERGREGETEVEEEGEGGREREGGERESDSLCVQCHACSLELCTSLPVTTPTAN